MRLSKIYIVSEVGKTMTDILLSESEKTYILHGVEQNFRQPSHLKKYTPPSFLPIFRQKFLIKIFPQKVKKPYYVLF
jgi:hypothetical protein